MITLDIYTIVVLIALITFLLSGVVLWCWFYDRQLTRYSMWATGNASLGSGFFFPSPQEKVAARTADLTRQGERTQVEQALQANEARLNFLLTASPAVLYTVQVTDHNFLLTYLSPNIERISGYTAEEFLADPAFWSNHLHPQDASRVLTGLSTLREQGHLLQDYRFLMSSGEYRWMRDRARLVRHDDDTPDEMIGYWVDIHEQQMAEEAGRHSEAQYRALFQKIPLPTYTWRRTGEDFVLVEWNEAAVLMSDGKISSLLGRRLHEMYENSTDILRDFHACIEGQTVVRREMRYTLKSSGVTKNLRVHYAFVPPDAVIVHTEDIAEQKEMEEVLRDREAWLQRAEALARIGHYAFDADLGNALRSEGLDELWGYDRYDNPPLSEYFRRIHPQDQKLAMAALEKAIQDKTGFDVEYRIVRPDGKVRAVHSVAEITLSQQGEPARFFGTMIDITESKRIELQLREALEERETLLREIHHRVKNNLQIVGSLLYLQARQTNNPEIQSMLRESRNRILAMSLIHQKLYQSTNLSRINFADYARELVQALLLVYGATAARVTLDIPTSEVTLDINHAVPYGIIINEVVSNTLKYAFPHVERGTIHVELQQDAHNQCHLLLWDDGVGLPPDFETRAQASLGTTLIKRLVEQLQGTLEYSSSTPGVGYRLTFPQPIDRPEKQDDSVTAQGMSASEG